MTDDYVSVGVVAEYLKVSEKTVQNYVKQGLLPKARHGKYHLLSCIHKYIDHLQEKGKRPEDVESLEGEIQKAELQIKLQTATWKRIQNEKELGLLIPSETLEVFLTGLLVTLRQQFLALPLMLAPEVITEPDEKEVTLLLQSAIEGVLHDFSQSVIRFSDDLDEPGIGADMVEDPQVFGPSTEDHGEPVGGSIPVPKRRAVSSAGKVDNQKSRVPKGDDGRGERPKRQKRSDQGGRSSRKNPGDK